MGSSASMLNTLLHGFGSFLTFAIEVTLLVVVLTTVKPRRPDAFMPLVGGAALHVAATVMSNIFFAAAPSIFERGETLMTVYAVFGFLFTLLRVVGWAAIILGVYKLASSAGGPGGPPPPRF